MKKMSVRSPAYEDGETLPKKYTCEGEKINPPLIINNIPEKTKSLALVFDDPDAAIGTFIHWLAWNIPPDASGIAEGSVPAGAVEGMNSGGRPGYFPPCPRSGGTHRYVFHIYALDTRLELGAEAERQQLDQAMQGHIIAQAELMGKYKLMNP